MRTISMILASLVLTVGFCGCGDSKDDDVIRKYQQQQDDPATATAKPALDPNSPEAKRLALLETIKAAKAKTPDAAPEVDVQILSMIRRRNESNLLAISSALTMYAASHKATLPMTLDDLVTAKMITAEELYALHRRETVKVDLTQPVPATPADPQKLSPIVAGAPLVYVAAGRKLVTIPKEQNAEFVLVYNPEPVENDRLLVATLDGKVKAITQGELARRLKQQKAGQ